jgi:hypothetical protein
VEGKWQFWNFQTCQARLRNELDKSTNFKRIFPEKPSLYLSRSRHNFGALTRRLLVREVVSFGWLVHRMDVPMPIFGTPIHPTDPEEPSYFHTQQERAPVIGVWLSSQGKWTPEP